MTSARNATAAAIVLGVVAFIGLIVYAGNRILDSFGPSTLAVGPGERLYVVSHGAIHVFAPTGQRERSIELANNGLDATPPAIAVLRDGRLMIAERYNPAINRCDATGRNCERLALDVASHTLEHLVPGNSFRFHVDEDRGRIYISDNGGNRLVIADLAGKTLAASPGDRSVVHFPNHIWSEKAGELKVIDTNHTRVATFDVSADRVGPLLGQMSTSASGVARVGCVSPFDAARVGSDLWLLLAKRGMRDADVVVFRDGKPARRVDLGADSDPFAIASWAGQVAVADATRYRLLFVGPDGSYSDVADPVFAQELVAARAVPEYWKKVRLAAQVGVVLLPFVGVLILWKLGVPLVSPSRQPIMPVPGARPKSSGAWIEVQPSHIETMIKRQRNALLLVIPIFIFAPVYFYFVHGAAALDNPKALAMAITFVGVIALAIVATVMGVKRQVDRLRATRLRAADEGLRYVAPRTDRLAGMVEGGPIPWKDVYFDGFKLLAGSQPITVKLPLADDLFARPALESEILACVPKANLISSSALAWRTLRLAPTAVKVFYALVTVALVAYVANEVLRFL